MKKIAYIGAWGADIQGNSKPGEGDGGVKAYCVDNDGVFTLIDHVTPQVNAGSIVISADSRYLYATDERKDMGGVHGNGGGLCAYTIDPASGKLTFLNEVSSAGAYPCYIIVDSKGRYAFAANHGNHEEVVTTHIRTEHGTYIAKRTFDEGSVGMFPIQTDGSLGECVDLHVLEGSSVIPWFQWTPHPHSVCVDPTDTFLLSGDKGADLIRVWRIDYAAKRLECVWEQGAQKGSGPRHIAFHPTLSVMYCNGEQNNTVFAYGFDAETGRMSMISGAATVPADYVPGNVGDTFDNNQTADIKVHGSGKFLYVSNRGHNSVAAYRLDGEGRLELIEIVPSGGEIPRAMQIDGDILYVVNQRSGNAAAFDIDKETGAIKLTGYSLSIQNPVSLQFTNK